jgi:glycosyltransferase involved in cell wall biosynthesis
MGFSPLKIFEYMAAGVPIVSSDLPSIREILVDKKTGLLVEPENVEKLARAIIKLIQDRKLSNQLSSNGRKKVEENYSWAAVTRKLIGLYEELNS